MLDRLVGYKISPLLWQKVKKGLSAGRVQSVATRMICDREREIDEFVPEEYWVISGKFHCAGVEIGAKLLTLNGGTAAISNREAADAALDVIRAQNYAVSAVRKGEKRKNPAAPFTTSNLQQEASRKLGFTTQKTMQIARILGQLVLQHFAQRERVRHAACKAHYHLVMIYAAHFARGALHYNLFAQSHLTVAGHSDFAAALNGAYRSSLEFQIDSSCMWSCLIVSIVSSARLSKTPT